MCFYHIKCETSPLCLLDFGDKSDSPSVLDVQIVSPLPVQVLVGCNV